MKMDSLVEYFKAILRIKCLKISFGRLKYENNSIYLNS